MLGLSEPRAREAAAGESLGIVEGASLWQQDIGELTGRNLKARGREQVNHLLQEGWRLLYVYTLKYRKRAFGGSDRWRFLERHGRDGRERRALRLEENACRRASKLISYRATVSLDEQRIKDLFQDSIKGTFQSVPQFVCTGCSSSGVRSKPLRDRSRRTRRWMAVWLWTACEGARGTVVSTRPAANTWISRSWDH